MVASRKLRGVALALLGLWAAVILAACGGSGGDGDDSAAPTPPTPSDGVVIAPGSEIVSASLGDAPNRIYVVPGETTERSISIVQRDPAAAQFDVSVTEGSALLASRERDGRHFVEVDSRSLAAGSSYPYKVVIRNRANGATAEITGQVLVLTPQVVATGSIGASGGMIAMQNGGGLEFDPQPGALPLGVTVSVADAPSGARWVRVTFDRDVSTDTRLVRFVQPNSSPTGTGRASALAANRQSRIASYPTESWSSGRAYYMYPGSYRLPEKIAASVLAAISCYAPTPVRICMIEQDAWELKAPREEGERIAADRNAVPVLFVHGFQPDLFYTGLLLNGGTDYWGAFPQLLQELDPVRRRVVPFEFRWFTNARFEDVADELAKAIELIYARTGDRRVTIVAHSFGGVLARTMLQGLGTRGVAVSDKVEQLITIGTPHSGIADAQMEVDKVSLPGGQDSRVFEVCNQISCYQMGEPVAGVAVLASPLGVDTPAGSLAGKLSTTLGSFPSNVHVAVGIGLALERIVDGTGFRYRYRNGDALISWSGQRLRPDDGLRGSADPSYLACQGSGTEGNTKEILLGGSDGREPNRSLTSAEYSEPRRRGHGHSSSSLGFTQAEGTANVLQADPSSDRDCSAASGCTHASFELVKAALIDGICRPPIITDQSPRLVSVGVGSTASLAVSAVSAGLLGGGELKLKYQWLKSPDMSTRPSAIEGATGATYVIPSVAATDNGWVYWVRVTGPDGISTISQEMALRVVVAPPPDGSCAVQSVSWTQGASTCSASYGGGASGTSSLLSDATAPTTGTATAVCTNGVVGVISATCTTATPPSMVAPTPLAPSGTITSLAPVFSWSGGSGAANYEINVRDLTTNLVVLKQQGISTASSSFAMPAGILVNARQYRWDITACPDFACSSGYVTSGDFTFVTQVGTGDPAFGRVVSGSISSAGEVDTFTFYANAGDSVVLTTTRTSGDFTPYMRLFNPDGSSNSSNFGSPVASLSRSIAVSGTYTLLVSDGSSGNARTGGYDIQFARIAGVNEHGALVNGGTRSETITVGDLDTFTFYANAGESVVLTAARTSGVFTPYIRLFNPDGSSNSSNFGSPVASLSRSIPVSGTYTLVVSDGSSGNALTGGYDVQFARTPGANEHGELISGGTRSETITVGDLDTFTFYANAGESVVLTAARTSGVFTPYIRLFNPDGSSNSSNFGSPVASFSRSIPVSGTYTLVVSDGSSGNERTGGYDIQFARTPGANEHGALVNGGTRSETITVGDLDTFTFYANAGESVVLTATRTSGDFTPYIRLFKPDGSSDNSNFGSPVASLSRSIPVSGTYTLVVSDGSSGNERTGGYDIQFARTAGGQ